MNKFAIRLAGLAGAALVLCAVCFGGAAPQKAKTAATPSPAQLEKYARLLKENNSNWGYQQLSAIAMRKGTQGARAALALGYYDYLKAHYETAEKWFDIAKEDPVLADYALYWRAENDLAMGRPQQSLEELKRFREKYPDSTMTEQALQGLGEAAMGSNQPAEAITALSAYAGTSMRPSLLLLLGEAQEKAGKLQDAAASYQALYVRYPQAEAAREATTKLAFLRSTLGSQYPELPVDQRVAHAATLFMAHDWFDARNEYANILTQLSGPDHERAELRILECGVYLGATPAEMSALQISDPDVNAERSYTLADFFRKQQNESEMIAAVEAAAAGAPSSDWSEAALFLVGNYYWLQLDRDKASSYYKRVEEQFPMASDALAAQWRVAWTAVLKRDSQAAAFLETHLRRFPGSMYTPDALYWLGRLAEDAGVPGLARSYYEKVVERYPENYFETLALTHLRGLPAGPSAISDVVDTVPPPPRVPQMSDAIPAAAMPWQRRADALSSIAFDSSAELELRAGYLATGEPRLLLEAAQAAISAGHCGAAIVAVRQAFPQLESQPMGEVPRSVWLTAYALPFASSIRRWSAKQDLDPMLVAGLIRQESAFEPEARSPANAFGLMQLIPKTAHRVAREEKVHYSQARLFDPDYNVRLGTAYVAGLEKQFGNIESVLAAYNAGEDRVASWTAGQNYREPAEFVDSIPFTETRQYVELVARNADVYRRLYGVGNEPRKARVRVGH